MAERETTAEMRMTGHLSNAGHGDAITPDGGLPRRIALAIAGLFAALMLSLAILVGPGADQASAKSAIFEYSSHPSETQAGGHPDIWTDFFLGTRFNQGPIPFCSCNDPKDVTVHAPAGVIANPHVLSVCKASEAALFECPADSQAGLIVLRLFGYIIIPVYRTEETKGQAGLFVFSLPFGLFIPQYSVLNARTGGDFGLDIKVTGISHFLPLEYYAPGFWGVPGDPKHDIWRFNPGEKAAGCTANPLQALEEDVYPEECQYETTGGFFTTPKPPHPTSLPVQPFTQNPTVCSGPLSSSLDTLAYDRETDHAEAEWPATTGCDKLSFDPSLSANPTTSETDTASGLDVRLRVPQFQDPETPSPSEIRESTLTLPPGFSINPNAADGKFACSDLEARIGTEEEAKCPEFSKVGTLSVESSALPGTISGAIYIGEPKPGDPYRIILTANGFGTAIKLPGSIHADPQTGQLVTQFEDLPQSPFQLFDMHFFGSERGLLATPTQCGTYPVKTVFRPWDDQISNQTSTQFFTIDSGPEGSPCPGGARPFEPRFEAGTADNTAGVHSAFSLKVARDDGDQNVVRADVSTPRGFSATIAGVPYCPESALATLANPSYTGRAELASPACPAASQIGTVVAGTGAGTHPLYSPGKVYLAGPYRGAPLSLEFAIPAVSGPYDLGNVAVRAPVVVDRTTAEISTSTDPIPEILEGIPLRIRSLQVNLDRSNFALNPTNCAPFSLAGGVFGNEGALANRQVNFQVANCRDLGFAPKLGLKLHGSSKRRGHPSLQAVLRSDPGESNIRRAVVVMPKSELLDNSHIGTVCTRVQFAAGNCPGRSIYGSATVETPLLDDPLRGPVYLRSSSHKLPDLVADLHGQIDIELAGRIDSAKGSGLRARFETVPDAPVSKFVLNMKGGRQGLLVNSTSLCGSRKTASVRLTGQNGARSNRKTNLQTPCGSKASRGQKRRARVYRAGTVR